MNDQVILSCLLCLGGLLGHVMAKWGEHREADPHCTLVNYFHRVAPAKTMLAAISAVTVIGALYGMGWLNPGAGLATGWAANSAIKNFSQRVLDK